MPPYLSVVGLEKAAPIKMDTTLSLVAILGTLAVATVLSVLFPRPAGTAHA